MMSAVRLTQCALPVAVLTVCVGLVLAQSVPSDEPASPVEKPTSAPEEPASPDSEPPPLPSEIPTLTKPETQPPTMDFPGAKIFNGQPPFLAGIKLSHDDLNYREGEKLSLGFLAEKDAHLYLLYHQADGKTFLLYPNEAQMDNRIAAKKPVLIPPRSEPFRFRVRPPFGTEVLQVIASEQPLTELDSLVREGSKAAPVSRDVIDTLADRLSKDLTSWTEQHVAIVTAANEADPHPPTRAGLFIGVNKYTNPKSCLPMEELRRGAELMARTFADHGGIDAQHSKLLIGEQATRANIEQAICQWLPSITQPGDVVFIFYTGHGGTVRNLDGTEPDGRDETLSTYDNDLGEGITTMEELEARLRKNRILDKTLARWLQELQGRQIVLILDSCHSGGMVDAKGLVHFFDTEAARVKDISQMNVVVVAGCGPDESVRTPIGPDVVSWMPRKFAEAMTSLPRPVTVRTAYDHYVEAIRPWLKKAGAEGLMEPSYTDTALLPIVLAP